MAQPGGKRYYKVLPDDKNDAARINSDQSSLALDHRLTRSGPRPVLQGVTDSWVK